MSPFQSRGEIYKLDTFNFPKMRNFSKAFNRQWDYTFFEYLKADKIKRRRIRRIYRMRRNYDSCAVEVMEKVLDYTMIPNESLFSLIEAVRYVNSQKLPGSFVECGVWRGGATMAAALTLKQLEDTERTIYLYDTFTGMTEPKEQDSDPRGKIDIHDMYQRYQTDIDESDWCRASLDDVKQNMRSTGYPTDNFIFVEGKVEDTLPDTLPEIIAILRLDTDWYESTKQEMIHLFPRLVSKGVIIVDDYYSWTGSKLAVDEFLDSINLRITFNRVADSVIGIKP